MLNVKPQFYVYTHSRPDMSIFYVGKGSKSRAFSFYKRNKYHRAIVEKYGISEIKIELYHVSNEQEAFDLEQDIIATLKETGLRLANMTDGGEGPCNPSEEVREKIRKARLGKPGHKHTEQAKKKIGEAARRLIMPESAKQKISKANKGHPGYRAKTQEALNNQKNSRKGIKNSPEHRAKISAGKLGHDVSSETRAKIGAANKKRWEEKRLAKLQGAENGKQCG